MHAYCLFCETKRCKTIAAYIENTAHIRCFAPQIVQRKWVKGVPEAVMHDWLPGYIFLYSEEPIKPYYDVSGIIRWLQKDELAGSDLAFAEMLLKKNGVVGEVRVAQVGDRVKVDDPAWEGLHGEIIKLDRQRKRCCVAFDFDGMRRTIWVGYELLETETTDA